jgi:hypothetical protein
MSACDWLADSNHTCRHVRKVPNPDVDAIVDDLISIGGANSAEGRPVALVVKHEQTSHRRRAA